MLKRLESLPLEIERIFRSATCVCDPLHVVLDELQIALEVPRLDAHIRDSAGAEFVISSALRRERDECDRNGAIIAMDHATFGTSSAVPPSSSRVRRAMVAAHDVVTVGFEADEPRFNELSLRQISLWVDGSGRWTDQSFRDEGRQAISQFLCECAKKVGSLPKANAMPFSVKANAPFVDLLAAPEARIFLATALAQFDTWLKRLLAADLKRLQSSEGAIMSEGAVKARSSKLVLLNPFLAQFFWVAQRRENQAQITPIFLPEQQTILQEVATRLVAERGLSLDSHLVTAQEAAEFANLYQLDARSSLSAYAADTLLSVYVEGWPQEPLVRDPLLESLEERARRSLFALLTSECQLEAARKIDSDIPTPDRLTLFAVPVTVGIVPLFVVQINYLDRLPLELRSLIASAIRQLGGLMLFYSELYAQQQQNALEVSLEHSRAIIFPEIIIRDLAHDLLKTLPGSVQAPLRNALEKADQSRTDSCTISKAEVKVALAETGVAVDRFMEIRQQLDSGFKKTTTDIREAIIRALRDIPASKMHNLDVEKVGDWDTATFVSNSGRNLEAAIQNVVINAAEACGDKGALRIVLTPGVADPASPSRRRVKIEFRDNGPGVPKDPAAVKRLWAPKVTTKPNGTGWGLFLIGSLLKYNYRDGFQVFFDTTVSSGANLVMILPTIGDTV